MSSLPEEALEALEAAHARLEHPGLAARIGNLAGTPIEQGLRMLPARWRDGIDLAVRAAIERALDLAVGSMNVSDRRPASDLLHRIAATASGGAGGAFGLGGLAVELPVSTTIMLRSIADIARSEGEDLSHPEARLQCVQVLALGGPSKADDAAESGYFAARAALAKAVSEAAAHVAKRGLAEKSAPVIARLIAQVASRFSVVVSEKAAAQAVPVVGALGGALVNMLFIEHFQDMARGHFVIRRLERVHGQPAVREAYLRLGTGTRSAEPIETDQRR